MSALSNEQQFVNEIFGDDSLIDPDVAKDNAALNFTRFKEKIYRRYLHGNHLELLDNALMQVSRYVETGGKEGIGRLIVAMPPRHGKSMTVSRLYPAWHIGNNPDDRVMLVSYGADLAEKHSRYVRNYVVSRPYKEVFPGVLLAKDSKASDAWDVEGHEGGMDALGIGGAATGKGAHILIIDDPHKNRQEAESELKRERAWDAFTDDLYTRLEPGGAVIVMATRWHIDDLSGRLLTRFKERWQTLILPAVNENEEPLWPERFPIEVLRDIESTLLPYSWSSEYQQSPVPHEGGLFKYHWFEPLIDRCPEIVHEYRYWDLALSAKSSADATAGVKIGQGIDGHWYITDVAHKRIDWGDLTEYMASVILADGAKVQQGIEEAGFMSRAIGDLNQDPRLRGYAIFGYPVDKDKFTRALPFAAKCAAGLVHILNRSWTQGYLEELCLFTGTGDDMHDDQVDASSGAWAMTALGDAMATVADNGYMPMAGSY